MIGDALLPKKAYNRVVCDLYGPVGSAEEAEAGGLHLEKSMQSNFN